MLYERLSLDWRFSLLTVPERVGIPTLWFVFLVLLNTHSSSIFFSDLFQSPSCFGSRLALLYMDSEPGYTVLFLSLFFMSNTFFPFHYWSNFSCFAVQKIRSKVTWNGGDTNPVVHSIISATLLTWFGDRLSYRTTFELYSHFCISPSLIITVTLSRMMGIQKLSNDWYLFDIPHYWISGEVKTLQSCKGLVIYWWRRLPSLGRMNVCWQWMSFPTFCVDESATPLQYLVRIVSFVLPIHLNDNHARLKMLVSADFLYTGQPIYLP